MGERPPRKLDDAAIERCANIVVIERRDIFDPRLPKFLTTVWATHERPVGDTRERAARAKIMKTGSAFVRAVREAPLEVSRPIQACLPYGIVSLEMLIDEVGRSKRERLSSIGRRDQFIIMIYLLVKESGGKLDLAKFDSLLMELKPYVPDGFLRVTTDILRKLLKKAENLSRNLAPA